MKANRDELAIHRREQVLLLADGTRSSSHIAKTIGYGTTRNMVIGLVVRINQQDPGRLKLANKKTRTRQKAATGNTDRSGTTLNDRVEAARARGTLADMDLTKIIPSKSRQPVGVGRAHVALGPHDCRWPYGVSETFRFCGRKVEGAHVYCEVHTRQATSDWRRAEAPPNYAVKGNRP